MVATIAPTPAIDHLIGICGERNGAETPSVRQATSIIPEEPTTTRIATVVMVGAQTTMMIDVVAAAAACAGGGSPRERGFPRGTVWGAARGPRLGHS